MFTKWHKSIAIFLAYFYLHVFAYKYLNLVYILCVFLSFLDTNFSQVHALRQMLMYEHHKNSSEKYQNKYQNRDYPSPLYIGWHSGFSSQIRRIPTKSGQLDSLVTNSLPTLLYPTCTDLSPNQNPTIATASNIQNYHLSFHLLFLRSVAKMCRAAISNSFLRWATSCGQYRRRPSIPPTMFCEQVLTMS